MAIIPMFADCPTIMPSAAGHLCLHHPLFASVLSGSLDLMGPCDDAVTRRSIMRDVLTWWLAETPKAHDLPLEYFKVRPGRGSAHAALMPAAVGINFYYLAGMGCWQCSAFLRHILG